MATIATRTGWRPIGLVPFFEPARRLPAEDALALTPTAPTGGRIRIAVPILPRIANFDDLDPLAADPQVELIRTWPGTPLPGDAHLILLPGSKSTIADLAALRAAGFDIDIAAHLRRGGRVLGLCAGYQMLGREIADPAGVEGPPGAVPGLGHLDVTTEITAEKRLLAVEGATPDGHPFHGFEMHMGRTLGPDCARPFATLAAGPPRRRHLRRRPGPGHLRARPLRRRRPAFRLARPPRRRPFQPRLRGGRRGDAGRPRPPPGDASRPRRAAQNSKMIPTATASRAASSASAVQ